MSKQDQIYQAIVDHWREFTVPPVIRQVQQRTGVSSTSLIHDYYKKLERCGRIKIINSKPVPVEIEKLIKESYQCQKF